MNLVQTDKDPTPTETLITALEDFSEAEPTKLLVIYQDAEGSLRHRSSGLWGAEKIGMMEIIKNSLLKESLES